MSRERNDELAAAAEACNARLERFRGSRALRTPQPAVSSDFAAAARELERSRKRLAGVAGAWQRVCPPDLAHRTAIEGVSRGVLRITVADAAARFHLDRFLRTGGEQALLRAAPTTVRKVRLSVGPVG